MSNRRAKSSLYRAEHFMTQSNVISPAGSVIAHCPSKVSANLVVRALNSQLNLQQARTTMRKVIGSNLC